MRPWFETPEEVAQLRAVATSWKKTPWTANGAVKGTGASCSMLPYAILAECGFVAPTPPARDKVLKNQQVLVMKGYLNGNSTHFQPVAIDSIQAGDVLLFDCGIGHLAIAMGGTEIMHSWQSVGAHFGQYIEEELFSRLLGAWRPIYG